MGSNRPRTHEVLLERFNNPLIGVTIDVPVLMSGVPEQVAGVNSQGVPEQVAGVNS